MIDKSESAELLNNQIEIISKLLTKAKGRANIKIILEDIDTILQADIADTFS